MTSEITYKFRRANREAEDEFSFSRTWSQSNPKHTHVVVDETCDPVVYPYNVTHFTNPIDARIGFPRFRQREGDFGFGTRVYGHSGDDDTVTTDIDEYDYVSNMSDATTDKYKQIRIEL